MLLPRAIKNKGAEISSRPSFPASKRVLIVCPNFPPVNTADGARARMMLPYLKDDGWESTVAAMCTEQNPNNKDEYLLATIPPETEVHHLPAWDEKWCRKVGFGHLSNRIFWPWRGAVLRLLKKNKYDLVFISTTASSVMTWGPYWKKHTGVPYVIDLHDPIYVPGGSYTKDNAPGGYFKYRLANLLNRWIERRAFSRAGGVVSTSEHYLITLRDRYPHLRQVPMAAIPFGVPFRDLEVLPTLNLRNRFFEKNKNQTLLFYAGRGGPDLHPALDALFLATAKLKDKSPEQATRLSFVFVGTSYSPSGDGVRQVVPIAEKHGVGNLVTENPGRASYFEVLQGMREADAALVLGSTRPDYTASKALLCAAAAPRTLAILHRESLPARVLAPMESCRCIRFRNRPEEPTAVAELLTAVADLSEGSWPRAADKSRQELRPYSAQEMTRQVVALFQDVFKKER